VEEVMPMLTRWNPFDELISMREAMDRLFNQSFLRPGPLLGLGSALSQFPCDIYETGDAVVVRAAIPGVEPHTIELAVDRGLLTIKGTRTPYPEEQAREYIWHLRGLAQGHFQFTVSLPTAVNADAAEAAYDAGILTVTLPKAEAVKAKRIPIKGVQQAEALPAGAR
jgi:HSP20 family protein